MHSRAVPFFRLFFVPLPLLVGCLSQFGYPVEDSSETRSYCLQRSAARRACPKEFCRVVGRVHAHTRAPAWLPFLLSDSGELRDALWEQAERMGATSVVGVTRFSWSQFEWREEHLVGTAIQTSGLGAESDDP